MTVDARQARDEALAAVDTNAHELWKLAAEEAMDLVIARGLPFTADDVWEAIPEGFVTHEPRAMGPVFMRAIRQRRIQRIGWANTPRASRHNAPVSVYRVRQDPDW